MIDTRKLVEELEVEAKAAHHGDGLASLFWNVADTITALSERCRALEEAIHDADQTLMLLGDTGWRHRHRAALTSGGRG